MTMACGTTENGAVGHHQLPSSAEIRAPQCSIKQGKKTSLTENKLTPLSTRGWVFNSFILCEEYRPPLTILSTWDILPSLSASMYLQSLAFQETEKIFLKIQSRSSICRNLQPSETRTERWLTSVHVRGQVQVQSQQSLGLYLVDPLSHKGEIGAEYFVPEKCISQRPKQSRRRLSEFPVGLSIENNFCFFNETHSVGRQQFSQTFAEKSLTLSEARRIH